MNTYEELQPWCSLTPDQFFTATNGRKNITPLEICNLDIPAIDRVRVLICSGCIEQDKLERAIGRIVDRAVRMHCLNCGLTEVERWAEKWLSGADRTSAAAYAAYAAATATAYVAADAVAIVAYTAYTSADDVAAAAAAVVVVATADAADDAYGAYDVEWEKQIKDFVAVLSE